MKANQKITLIQQFAQWLNSTVTFEDEVTGATAPTETYTIELDGEETILNVYEDNTTEPALGDGKYPFKEDGNKLIVIEDGLFKGLEEIEQPEPTTDPLEDKLPVAQEDEEKKEETETGNDDETKKALDEALAKIAELEAKIAELEAALAGKETEIEALKKQPTAQKAETRKVDNEKDTDRMGRLIQALNKKTR